MSRKIGLLSFGVVVLAGVAYYVTSDSAKSKPDAIPASAVQSNLDLWPAIESPLKKDEKTEAMIAELLARMTVEEKVGQTFQVEIQHITPEEITKYHIGSVLNGGGSLPNRNKYATPGEWLALADSFYKASIDETGGRAAVPIIWGSDAVHGHNNVIGATIFPHNIGLGAANNPELIREIGAITALEMRATGIDWTFAPTLAVAQNDRWGRTYESYSEKPEIVKSFAGKMVEGLQGKIGDDNFLDTDHVVSTAKHFLGDGGTWQGDDQGDARITEKELAQIHAAGYETALKAGAQTVMASFSSWNGEKMHGNKYLLTDVLKGRMGFDGLVVGDWNGHGQIPGCHNGSCPQAINAGLDLFMVIEDWKQLYANTLEQVKSGVISMERLDDAVARILRVKIRAGLFEKGMPSSRGVAGRDDIIGRTEHREVARQAVRESMVLLKNKDGLLPLKPGQNVLVAGDAAHNIGKQSGGWSISWQGTGNVNSDFPGGTSIYQGIETAVKDAGGKAVLSEDGSYAEKPDVAIVVVGEEPYAEGQGDLETLEYQPGNKRDLALVKKLKADGVPVVTVFLSGRPLWVNPEINASDAFVAAWLPGSEGVGVADVLVAGKDGKPKNDFKGKLSFSWPNAPVQDKLNKHHDGYAPLFELGYGLTYASGEAGPVDMLAEDVEGVRSGDDFAMDLYKGRPQAPWMMLLVDHRTQAQLSGAYAALPSGLGELTVVDKDIQGDALRMNITGEGEASLTLAAGPALDWTAAAKGGAVITFDMSVVKAGSKASLSLDCGSGCKHELDLTKAVEMAEANGWQQVSKPLACFGAEAEKFSGITTPFRLSVTGPADVSVANIVLANAPEGEAISCH